MYMLKKKKPHTHTNTTCLTLVFKWGRCVIEKQIKLFRVFRINEQFNNKIMDELESSVKYTNRDPVTTDS